MRNVALSLGIWIVTIPIHAAAAPETRPEVDATARVDESAAADQVVLNAKEEEDRGFELAKWGGLFWLSFGKGWGDDVAPAREVFAPELVLEAHGEASYAFGYAGVGFSYLNFDDAAPTSMRVENVETGDQSDAESSTNALMWHGELGVAHALKLGTRYFALRPGLGLGLNTNAKVNRTFNSCVDCPDEEVGDYRGGPYVRLHLGVCFGNNLGVGAVVSYQQFLGEASDPALNRMLTAGFAIGGGGGF